jgi:hypothetical protein
MDYFALIYQHNDFGETCTYITYCGFFCFDMQPSSSALIGNAENPLIGKMLLLIAKKNRRVDDLSDNLVEVVRVTDELDIVNEYRVIGNNYTPIKVCVLTFFIVCVQIF